MDNDNVSSPSKIDGPKPVDSLNSGGKPTKAGVSYGDAPLTYQSTAQPDMVVMTGPEGPTGPLSLDKASKLYTVTKAKVVG